MTFGSLTYVLSIPLNGDYSSPACFNAQINCCSNHLLKASWDAASRESPRRAQHPGSGINQLPDPVDVLHLSGLQHVSYKIMSEASTISKITSNNS